jgi:hypothetical protein
MFTSGKIFNYDWTAGRLIHGIEMWAHEGWHWVAGKIPFFKAASRVQIGKQPVGAIFDWADETIAYALGHAVVLRPQGLVVAPIQAFFSVFANFEKFGLGSQAVRWAAGEVALIGGALGTYFYLDDDDSPPPPPAGTTP